MCVHVVMHYAGCLIGDRFDHHGTVSAPVSLPYGCSPSLPPSAVEGHSGSSSADASIPTTTVHDLCAVLRLHAWWHVLGAVGAMSFARLLARIEDNPRVYT